MSWKRFIIICLLLLAPYLFLGFFNYPSADDFTYAVPVLHKGFWQAQIDWYSDWSGRFVSTAILSASPIVYKSYVGYKFIGISTFVLFVAALYFFLDSVLAGVLSKRFYQGFFVLFLTVLLSEIPSITEAFHWFAGVVNYTYAFILFLVSLGFYLRCRNINLAKAFDSIDFKNGAWSLILVLSLTSFLLAGFNETLVVIWLYLIFVAQVIFVRRFKKMDTVLVLPFIVGLVSFYFVYKAPGNAVRAAQFHGTHDVLFTLFRPLGLFVEIFVRYLKIPFLIFLLLIVPDVERLKEKIKPKLYSNQARWFSFLFFLSLVFLFLAPAHWAIGGAPPRRAMNILCFIYVSFILWMYSQWIWANHGLFLFKYKALPKWAGRNVQMAVLLVSFLVLSNHGVAWADLLFRARDYASQQQDRIELLEKSTSDFDIVVAPLRKRPETLFFSDLEPDPNDWINKSVSDFYGVKSIRAEELAN